MPQHVDEHPGKTLAERLGPDLILALAARTSEMMFLPEELCPIRRCRRARACQRIAVEGRLPACIHTLPSEYLPCFKDYLGFSGTVCADARDGEHGAVFQLLELLPPCVRGNTVSIVRDCLAGNAAALACLDATLALIAETKPPLFERTAEAVQVIP